MIAEEEFALADEVLDKLRREIERLRAALAASEKRFAEHHTAWVKNNEAHAETIEDLKCQLVELNERSEA